MVFLFLKLIPPPFLHSLHFLLHPSVLHLSRTLQQNSITTPSTGRPIRYCISAMVFFGLETSLLEAFAFSSSLDWLLSRLQHSCCLGTSLHHQVSKLKSETHWQKKKKKKIPGTHHITSKSWNLSRDVEEKESLMKPLSDYYYKKEN